MQNKSPVVEAVAGGNEAVQQLNSLHLRGDGGGLFTQDSTFAPIAGLAAAGPSTSTATALEWGSRITLVSHVFPDRYVVRQSDSWAYIRPNDGTEAFKRDATWIVRPGLADSSGVSFESVNYPGSYLKNWGMRIKLEAIAIDEGSRKDAT